MFDRYKSEELTATDLQTAHDNQLLNEMFAQSDPNRPAYAYPVYQNGTTYVGINNKDEYYVIRYDNMRPEEAIKRMKFKNLKTQYSDRKTLSDDDWKILDKCHKAVADYTINLYLTGQMKKGRDSK